MLSISNLHFPLADGKTLEIGNLNLRKGDSLLVVGDNASGKSVLAQIMSERINSFQADKFERPAHMEVLSFEVEADTLAEDRKNDNSEQVEGGIDWGRNAKDIIGEGNNFNEIIALLKIKALLDKPFKILSTGEIRKVLMARALMTSPDLIILDEPFAGLDIQSQQHLTHVLTDLINAGTSIILFDFFHSGLPTNFNQIALMQSGKVTMHGLYTEVTSSEQWQTYNKVDIKLPHYLPDCLTYDHLDKETPLVKLQNVDVSFEQKAIFKNLSWQFEQGQHWQIIGPNGCGKSTLLSMISGDSTKAYGKDLWLFGVKRGSGETIWDIKRHYGLISAQLHRDYRVSTTLLQTVISGFYDSIGLYDRPSKQQINIAREWLVLLGLEAKENTYFSELSYGEQRLALIARGIVKLPLILVLDEPCQGLDNANRAKVLALVDYIAANSKTNILFVSHDSRDKLQCLTHEMEFIASEQGYITEIRELIG